LIMPRATSARNRASEQGSALLGTLFSGSCESRFALLRNVRVAGVQFLISVTVRGPGGDAVPPPFSPGERKMKNFRNGC
jgi:hypothetical protein